MDRGRAGHSAVKKEWTQCRMRVSMPLRRLSGAGAEEGWLGPAGPEQATKQLLFIVVGSLDVNILPGAGNAFREPTVYSGRKFGEPGTIVRYRRQNRRPGYRVGTNPLR